MASPVPQAAVDCDVVSVRSSPNSWSGSDTMICAHLGFVGSAAPAGTWTAPQPARRSMLAAQAAADVTLERAGMTPQ